MAILIVMFKQRRFEIALYREGVEATYGKYSALDVGHMKSNYNSLHEAQLDSIDVGRISEIGSNPDSDVSPRTSHHASDAADFLIDVIHFEDAASSLVDKINTILNRNGVIKSKQLIKDVMPAALNNSEHNAVQNSFNLQKNGQSYSLNINNPLILSKIAFLTGPGSFTSIKIACSVFSAIKFAMPDVCILPVRLDEAIHTVRRQCDIVMRCNTTFFYYWHNGEWSLITESEIPEKGDNVWFLDEDELGAPFLRDCIFQKAKNAQVSLDIIPFYGANFF